jgi:hypothetical protein
VVPADVYCREIEAHLCRKNDGHLIRIVGPAFERVSGWAEQGIPLKVALAGIDRYFERYYRKGPRRRPVRVEFCDADVLDAFDEWRRAVGISTVRPEPGGGAPVEDPVPAAPRARRGLRGHVEAALARLTVLRGSDKLGGVADATLVRAVRALESLAHAAEHPRREERQTIVDALAEVYRELIHGIHDSLPERDRLRLADEALRELEPFRQRMAPAAYQQSLRAAIARSIREEYGVPEIAW